jgi:hypothetical protein
MTGVNSSQGELSGHFFRIYSVCASYKIKYARIRFANLYGHILSKVLYGAGQERVNKLLSLSDGYIYLSSIVLSRFSYTDITFLLIESFVDFYFTAQ